MCVRIKNDLNRGQKSKFSTLSTHKYNYYYLYNKNKRKE